MMLLLTQDLAFENSESTHFQVSAWKNIKEILFPFKFILWNLQDNLAKCEK